MRACVLGVRVGARFAGRRGRGRRHGPHISAPRARAGVSRAVWPAVNAGKGPAARYAESGQVLVDRGRHLDALEWAWFLNAWGEGGVYNFMYGDKARARRLFRFLFLPFFSVV